MKKYYAVEVSQYECGEIVDKTYIVKTANPEELYQQYTGNTTLAFNVRKTTFAERIAHRKAGTDICIA